MSVWCSWMGYFMKIDKTKCPDFLNDYILYISVTKSLSPRTIEEYYGDIRLFLKYILFMKDKNYSDIENLEDIPIDKFEIELLESIKLQNIYEFLYYLSEERENHDRARSRKVSTLKSFFKYLCNQKKIIAHNPMEQLELPTLSKPLPKYLTLEQSMDLLKNINTSYPERDYCILALFLNCGLRLSELVNLDVSDINFKYEQMTITGKGRKQRIVYLNNACIESIMNYLSVRDDSEQCHNEKALFLSKRHKRISKRRVQQIVENALHSAQLDNMGFSTHKLRHTAATLMYQYGGADVLALKEILGHESTSTTEIYTHLSNETLRKIAKNAPLANIKLDNKKEK